VITLREGVEAALIIAIVIAYLKKIGRLELARSAYAGLIVAVLASIGGAFALRRFEINQEKFEGWAMLAASAFIVTVVIWMWRTARRLKGEIEGRVDRLASRAQGQFSLGIFALVFLMVGREGLETVLLLGAVQLNTAAVMGLMGAVAGLAVAIVLGVLFVKGAINLNLRKFFSITSIVLLVVALQLLISGLHELSEAMVLPASQREMAIIGPVVKNDAFFYLIILGLVFLMLIRRPALRLPDSANPAERRKALYEARRERLILRALQALILASMAAIAAQFVHSMSQGQLSPPEQYFDGGNDVRLPMARLEDGRLHRFAYRAGDRTVRFLVIKLGSGRVAVALDACQICGDKGYYQRGQDIICKNCTAPINPDTIGLEGGCNPIPLKFELVGSDLLIPASELEKGIAHNP
jgi:FTR1 family protein